MTEIFDDIKSKYRFQAPCDALSGCIEYFWESLHEPAAGGFTIRLFPSWTPTISINLGSAYEMTTGGQHFILPEGGGILHSRHSMSEFTYFPGNDKFGVKFLPGGLYPVLNPDRRLMANIVGLNQVLPSGLIGQVKHAATFEERVALLQDFFMERYQQNCRQATHLRTIHSAIDTYARSNMEMKARDVAGEMFTTSKTFYRNFNKLIGASPKSYLSVVRARAALTAYVDDKRQFNPFHYGYYDRSHFYKDVLMFTGKKLSDHLS